MSTTHSKAQGCFGALPYLWPRRNFGSGFGFWWLRIGMKPENPRHPGPETGSQLRCFPIRAWCGLRNTRGQRVNNRVSQRTGSEAKASINLAALWAWVMRILYSRPSVMTLGTRRTAVRPSRSQSSPKARAVVTSSASQPGSADGDSVSIATLSGMSIRTT